MRRVQASVVLIALLTATLTGCANADPAGPPAAGTTPAPSAPAPSAPAPSASAAAFPLVVTRTGGFAGVSDHAKIAADGTAVVTRDGQAPVRTTLPAATIEELRQVMAAPAFSGGAAPSAGATVCNDGFTYEFTGPAATGSLTDCGAEQGAQGRALAVARQLFQG